MHSERMGTHNGTPSARRSSRARVLGTAMLLVLGLGARLAAANDLSTSPCTASDVEIVGSGLIVNEPCTAPASGKFNATVQFTVRNNTSSARYCVSLHLVPDGDVLKAPLDVVLRDGKGSSVAVGRSGGERYHDTIMYGTIVDFPVSAGMVCFGGADVVKGKCAPGGCTTVSWNTSNGAATCAEADQNPPGGQCRHQQVCIVGYGASLTCATGCTAVCGSTSTLSACVVAPMSRGPFIFQVVGEAGDTLTQSSVGDASGTACLTFTVSPTKSPISTYALTVFDREKCTRTDTATVAVTSATVTITPSATPGCNGILSYSASTSGQTGCTYTWTVDGQSLSSFLAGGASDDARVARASGTGSSTFEFRALDNTCHSIEVSANCSPCVATASTTVKQCVTPTQACSK